MSAVCLLYIIQTIHPAVACLKIRVFFIIIIIFFFFNLPYVATPTMTQVPKTQTVFSNRTSNLWCPVEGAPAPYIVWRKNGVVVQNSTSVRYQLVATQKNVNYSCEIRRDNNVSRSEISLSIEGEFYSLHKCNGTTSLFQSNRRIFTF